MRWVEVRARKIPISVNDKILGERGHKAARVVKTVLVFTSIAQALPHCAASDRAELRPTGNLLGNYCS